MVLLKRINTPQTISSVIYMGKLHASVVSGGNNEVKSSWRRKGTDDENKLNVKKSQKEGKERKGN